MFKRIKIFRQGLHPKNSRYKEEPNHATSPLMCLDNEDEHQSLRKQDIHNASNINEAVNKLLPIDDSIKHQNERIQERAVIQDSSVEVPDESNFNLESENPSDLKPAVFVMHTYSDYKQALKLADKLKENGCSVILSSDIQNFLEEDHWHQALMAMLNKADFIIPVLTEKLVRQIFRARTTSYGGDDHEMEVNCFMYNLALNEFSRAYCVNYSVRPVCFSYEIANKVGNDPILHWCFHLWDEVPELVNNLKNTKKYLLDTSNKTSKYRKGSTKFISSQQTSNAQRTKSGKKKSAQNDSNLAEDKVALLIANEEYQFLDKLTTPAKDADDIAKELESIDFKVIVIKNVSKKEMESIIYAFCSLIVPNSYALFFFAGHGHQMYGQTYLLPVDCSHKYLPEESICKEDILECMQERETALNVFFLDCCRKSVSGPYAISNPIIVSMGKNTVFGYATTFSDGAFEKKYENSIFVKHLKKYICKDISIREILFQVQRDCNDQRLQNPVIESSLSIDLKLCDKLKNNTGKVRTIPWEIRQEDITETFVSFPDLKCKVVLKVKDPGYVYFDGVEMYVWLFIEKDATLTDFHGMEINIELSSVLEISPSTGVHLKDIGLQSNYGNVLFSKKIVGLQQMKNQFLKGNVLFKKDTNVVMESDFCIWLTRLKI